MSSIRAALALAREIDRDLMAISECPPESPVRISSGPTVQSWQGKDPPSEAELLAMSYEEFAKADLVLLVRSAVLGEDIVLVSSDEAARRAPPDKVVWVLNELGRLYATGKLNVDALQAIHRLKKGLGTAKVIVEESENENGT